ncbi:MAG: AAA family ATPase [Candidatus Nezhaarchaeota archaeon]|nr:AAA family ATPase [Candidatus Nezhaarchaeota archaeon]
MPGIFKDKGKLLPAYVPERLVHREQQMRVLADLLEVGGLGRLVYPKCIQVVGPTGSGKTSACLKLGRVLEQEALRVGVGLKPIYLNLRLEGASRFTIFKSMVEKVAFEAASRSLSPDEVLKQFLETLKSRKLLAILIVDEVDFHVRRSRETVVYDLTRLHELSSGESPNIVGVVFIAKDGDWSRLLDPAERSSLGALKVSFPPYSKDQVMDILEYRASEALNPGTAAREALSFIADLATEPPRAGDVRFALDMLLYSGVLAEEEGCSRITLDHVRAAYSMTLKSISTGDLEALSTQEKVVLLSTAKALSTASTPYIDVDAVRRQLRVTLEELGLNVKVAFDDAIKRLEAESLIEVKGRGIGMSIGPLGKLISVLESLIPRGVELGGASRRGGSGQRR